MLFSANKDYVARLLEQFRNIRRNPPAVLYRRICEALAAHKFHNYRNSTGQGFLMASFLSLDINFSFYFFKI